MTYELLAPMASISALLFAAYSAWCVLKGETGTARMNDISQAIRDGAMTYLRKQYKTIAIFVAISATALGLALGAFTALAFVTGAIFSALAGYIGMAVAVRANVRTTQAARGGARGALTTAFQGGTVMGMMVVGLALLGIYLLYLTSGDPFEVVGFGVERV